MIFLPKSGPAKTGPARSASLPLHSMHRHPVICCQKYIIGMLYGHMMIASLHQGLEPHQKDPTQWDGQWIHQILLYFSSTTTTANWAPITGFGTTRPTTTCSHRVAIKSFGTAQSTTTDSISIAGFSINRPTIFFTQHNSTYDVHCLINE